MRLRHIVGLILVILLAFFAFLDIIIYIEMLNPGKIGGGKWFGELLVEVVFLAYSLLGTLILGTLLVIYLIVLFTLKLMKK